ncbi:RloB domain-containing protein [Afipia massiliensis]|uniref:RloB domain-containing protein n=1 Tax=Afipia massiliensis TaxID=211460 RepID=UPI003D32396B
MRGAGQKVKVIHTRPCFEYWLLSHFEFTNAPFQGVSGGKSACDQVVEKITGHYPDFRKNNVAAIRRFVDDENLLQQGLMNYEKCSRCAGDNPNTNVGDLVRHLLGIAKIF